MQRCCAHSGSSISRPRSRSSGRPAARCGTRSRASSSRTGRGALLAEGKNYPAELYSAGTKAGKTGTERALESRRRIEAAIESVQAELGVSVDLRCWLDPLDPVRPGSSSLYQTANRIAYAVWLRRQGVEAWLCHLFFTDDPLHHSTGRAEWVQALATAERQLGIHDIDIAFVGHAFLPALDPDHVLADLRDRPARRRPK